MLANRADTYNLGDILSGKGDVFALSYIENAITSNPVLSPLATREQADIYKLVRMAQGEDVNTTELSHGYSAAEVGEIVGVLKHMFKAQDVLLKVNKQYIESASMDDRYRTEPRFQLQGSYRNMAKLAEKIVPAMNDAEVERLIDDHYIGEAQTLTSGAEHNLLKLGELRGTLTQEQAARWAQIKKDFARVKLMGGSDDDPIARVTGQLTGLSDKLENIGLAMKENSAVTDKLACIERAVMGAAHLMQQGEAARQKDGGAQRDQAFIAAMENLSAAVVQLQSPKLQVSIQNQPPPGVEELLAQQVAIIERTLVPLVRSTNENLNNPTKVDAKVQELLGIVRSMDAELRQRRNTVR